MAEGIVAYFGYGSLVNRATHRTEIVDAVPARLKGWRRCWRRRDGEGEGALLSVRRQADSVVDGLLVFDRLSNLPAVDLREHGYERVRLTQDEILLEADMPFDCPLYVYEVQTQHPPARLHILQSYLDAVLQGFMSVHGESGVQRFIAETEGFDAMLVEDRAAPNYPRAVTLAETERVLFDRLLRERGLSSAAP